MNRSTVIPALQLSIRAAGSAALALAIAQMLELQYPIYAMISAVIVTDLSPSETRKLSLRRLAGTILGALIGAVIVLVLPPSPWTVGFGILATMFLSHLVRLQGAAKVAGYVCGIVVLAHGDHPWSYALYRLIETVLGIGVAGLVSLLPKLLRVETTEQQDA